MHKVGLGYAYTLPFPDPTCGVTLSMLLFLHNHLDCTKIPKTKNYVLEVGYTMEELLHE